VIRVRLIVAATPGGRLGVIFARPAPQRVSPLILEKRLRRKHRKLQVRAMYANTPYAATTRPRMAALSTGVKALIYRRASVSDRGHGWMRFCSKGYVVSIRISPFRAVALRMPCVEWASAHAPRTPLRRRPCRDIRRTTPPSLRATSAKSVRRRLCRKWHSSRCLRMSLRR
jgi:hypothetical protein